MSGETTYCLTANQPTNQPTELELPEEYASLRITIEHTKYAELHDKVLFDLEWYISYPHTGKNRSNEHYHVFFQSGITERLRKRIKDNFGSGNKQFSFKSFKNGLASGIQYGSKEGTRPYYVGDECPEWILSAPPWEQRNAAGVNAGINGKPPRNPDHFKQITYSNMEKVCMRYRNDNGIKSTDLSHVLAHMHRNGWRLQVTVLRNGIPSQFFEEFTAQCSGDTTYCVNRFNRMKVMERWKEGA